MDMQPGTYIRYQVPYQAHEGTAKLLPCPACCGCGLPCSLHEASLGLEPGALLSRVR